MTAAKRGEVLISIVAVILSGIGIGQLYFGCAYDTARGQVCISIAQREGVSAILPWLLGAAAVGLCLLLGALLDVFHASRIGRLLLWTATLCFYLGVNVLGLWLLPATVAATCASLLAFARLSKTNTPD